MIDARPWPAGRLVGSGATQFVALVDRRAVLKILVVFTVWCILLVLCWPLALVAVVLAPLLWLVALPFRIVGICFAALFAFVKALLFLPARVIGYRG